MALTNHNKYLKESVCPKLEQQICRWYQGKEASKVAGGEKRKLSVEHIWQELQSKNIKNITRHRINAILEKYEIPKNKSKRFTKQEIQSLEIEQGRVKKTPLDLNRNLSKAMFICR